MRENTDQNNSEYGHFSRSVMIGHSSFDSELIGNICYLPFYNKTNRLLKRGSSIEIYQLLLLLSIMSPCYGLWTVTYIWN